MSNQNAPTKTVMINMRFPPRLVPVLPSAAGACDDGEIGGAAPHLVNGDAFSCNDLPEFGWRAGKTA
jgi:hypothetical protein